MLSGILSASLIIDIATEGFIHAILFAIPNFFSKIVGHPADSVAGLKGIGILSGTSLFKIFIVVLLLGTFIKYVSSVSAVAFLITGLV